MKTKWLILGAYFSTIPIANWMINNVGKQMFPDAPHTIPVGFGYQAPSGVVLVGLALVLRDFVQERFNKRITLISILIASVISWFVNPAVAFASASAFLVSEIADFVIYTKIRNRSKTLAIATSSIIGGVIDSFLFLQIAFNSTQFWQGQVIAKTEIALIIACVYWLKNAVSQRMLAIQS